MKYKIKRTVTGFKHEPIVVKTEVKKPKFDHKAVLIKSFIEALAAVTAFYVIAYFAKSFGII